MKYIPLAEQDKAEILKQIGVSDVEQLFASIPKNLRVDSNLDYPKAQSEMEIRRTFDKLESLSPRPDISFAGCGIYQHDLPAIIPNIQGRAEFATAYTPYQPEISQGLLQCIFEFQTLACQLTETELSNASLYDGATSLGEAVLMALRIQKKNEGKILTTGALHPHYEQVLNTYCSAFADKMELLELNGDRLDLVKLKKKLESERIDILVTQSPNIFGCIEDYEEIGKLLKTHPNTLWVTSTMEPLVWGLLKGPGAFGAHIVTAEGQSFGNAAYLGGSSYGFFCTKNEFIRNLPGRLVGETLDEESKRAFTLTFATREQFIRRGRATSNICTNNNLNMLAGLIHLCSLGKNGIREMATQNLSKTEYLKSKLPSECLMSSPTFNEFTIETKMPAATLVERSSSQNWICGVDLGRFKSEWKHKLLIHISELHTKEQIDQLASFLLKEVA
ncbi:MAG: aminomethyl-transferring glycine dehydrogenase [Deltaproteobacteria bacterium CG11_big_fil_rev_8_21_14_0_20_45_16]|nr:MAG: aminomethyl-transferring glycine dehydrogenase [Deltaproteobacteria bacterium CG11_big_fil_rev_8_21_14_0_20_45_16]